MIWEEYAIKTKSYEISKQLVWKAYQRVKANKGAAGIDGQTIEQFGEKSQDNLYKLWNRMSSGSYIPPPVRLVEIPKGDGSKRTLGIPTVTDRIAQMVAKMNLEPKVDKSFNEDSYGYRPGKSGLKAIGVTRKRCWQWDWVIDLDIKGFFDTIDHELMMRAVKKHTAEKWMLLYIERWLKVPGQKEGRQKIERTKGTPQGGVISPLLANLFLHHVFDKWMGKEFPRVPFERYADDIIVHCLTEKQAEYVLEKIKKRLAQCKLTLHPEKTKIVYCKDGQRTGDGRVTSFDFLGYTFCSRYAKGKRGQFFNGFLPAVSAKAQAEMRYTIRSWRLTSLTTLTIKEIAEKINPVVRGWVNYYGVYYRSEMKKVLRQIDLTLAKWASRKFKKLHRGWVKSTRWLTTVSKREPTMFAHWAWKSATTEQ